MIFLWIKFFLVYILKEKFTVTQFPVTASILDPVGQDVQVKAELPQFLHPVALQSWHSLISVFYLYPSLQFF